MNNKPFEALPIPEGGIFQAIVDEGQPVCKLNIMVDSYLDNLDLIVNARPYKDIAEKLFAYLLVNANTADPAWNDLRREAMGILR